MTYIITLFLLATQGAHAATSLLKLNTGREVVVEQEFNAAASTWLVVIPGSGCGLYNIRSLWIETLRAQFPLNVLVVNKAGVSLANECDQQAFNEGSLRHNRIADVNAVLNLAIPKSDRVILLAESEGGYLAPDVALSHSNVAGIVMISGGTRSWIQEELMMAPASTRKELRRFFDEEVIGVNDLNQFFRGWSYAQLNSFNTRETYHSLLKSQIPVLAMNGEKDGLIWLDGNVRDFRKLIEQEGKSNIEHHLILNGNHGLFCDDGGIPGACTEPRSEQIACEKLLGFAGKVIR